jgi:hypothetical protein
MTDPHQEKPCCGDDAKKTLHCRRTNQDYDVEKHTQCPYCFGEEKDVATGDYEAFCDFQPGKDPVSFGFPENTARNRHG